MGDCCKGGNCDCSKDKERDKEEPCCGGKTEVEISSEDFEEDFSEINKDTKLLRLVNLAFGYIENGDERVKFGEDLDKIGIKIRGCGPVGLYMYTKSRTLEKVYNGMDKDGNYTVDDFVKDVDKILRKYDISPKQVQKRQQEKTRYVG